MTREQLEHAIRAACDAAGDTELWVFGSQSLLGSYPDAPLALRQSIEVDVDPKNRPDRVDAIDGSLGELSPFHEAFGFYVHGVSIESAILPRGWRGRTRAITNTNTRYTKGHCLDPHDLAASKLAAYRPKDLEFVRTLLATQLIKPGVLITRINLLPIDNARQEQLRRWVDGTQIDLARRKSRKA